MVHWRASVLICALLTGRAMPLCALIGLMPDSCARRAYCRAMGRVFEGDIMMSAGTRTRSLALSASG